MMEEDIFRGKGVSFDSWLESFNLDRMPAEDRDRFLSSVRSLSKSPVLQWLLSRLEATMLMELANTPIGDKEHAEVVRVRLYAIKELRRTIHAFADDLTFEQSPSSTKF